MLILGGGGYLQHLNRMKYYMDEIVDKIGILDKWVTTFVPDCRYM